METEVLTQKFQIIEIQDNIIKIEKMKGEKNIIQIL